MCAGYESHHRTIKLGIPPAVPIQDAHEVEVGSVLKQFVEASGDDDIEIEIQKRASGRSQFGGEKPEFGPAKFQSGSGQRNDMDAWVEAAWVVGQADEMMRDGQMSGDHQAEPVDILGPVFAAPLDAEHGGVGRIEGDGESCGDARRIPSFLRGRQCLLEETIDILSGVFRGSKSYSLSCS